MGTGFRVSSTAPKIKGINLVGIGGRFTRQIFPLPKDRATIGREGDNDLVLTGSSVSRRHAELERTADGFKLRDYSSSNGTWVNGKRIEGAADIRHGDRIRIDRDEFLFVDADVEKFDTRGYRLAERETVTLGKLVWTIDGEDDELLLEEPTVTIGRDAANQLVLDAAGVSGNHCKIRSVDGRFTLVDLKSTNGTFLDSTDERIESLDLSAGTVFRVGSVRLRFETEEVVRPKPSQPTMPLMRHHAPTMADMLVPILAAFVVVATLVLLLLLASGGGGGRPPAVDPMHPPPGAEGTVP